ncbi:MAG TPA: hypothetical protein VF493_20945, partial [Terriglobales bacterium]
WVLEHTDTKETDVVVLAARLTGAGSGEFDLSTEQIFSDHEQELFTKAVSIAESFGKHISLLVVPARDVFSAIVQTALTLETAEVVAGLSTKMTAQEQALRMGQAWEAMPPPKREFVFQVVKPDLDVDTFRIGPHTPNLKPEDVLLVHRIWLDAQKQLQTENLHHSDIVSLALTRLARDYGRDKQEILRLLRGDGKLLRTTPPAGTSGILTAKPRSVTPPTEPGRATRETSSDPNGAKSSPASSQPNQSSSSEKKI